jgi:hypothetical protein
VLSALVARAQKVSFFSTEILGILSCQLDGRPTAVSHASQARTRQQQRFHPLFSRSRLQMLCISHSDCTLARVFYFVSVIEPVFY